MACIPSIDISKAKALEALRDYCGTDNNKYISYVERVVKEQAADGSLVPSADFISWYKKKYNTEPNFNAGTGEQLKKRIIQYCDEQRKDVSTTYRESLMTQIVQNYGYTSPAARSFGKRLAANMALDFYAQTETKLISNPIAYDKVQKAIKQVGRKTFFFNQVKQRFNKILAERIAARTEEDIELVKQKINTEKRSYVIKALGGKLMSLQDLNLVALVYEFNENPTSFVEEVCLDSRLGELRFNKDDEFNEENEKKAADAQATLEDENQPENDNISDGETDTTIAMFDHSGNYTTAMTHVGHGLRRYFNSLKKLNSNDIKDNGEPDYNIDNEFGLPDSMNADECSTVLYHYGDYSNIDNMIKSITDIANHLPGFAAFHTLAKDCANNRDFAFYVYCTFGKSVISKVETILDGNNTRSIISNKRSNKLDALYFEFLNSIKATAINNDYDFNYNEYKDLQNRLGAVAKYLDDKNGKFRKEVVSKIYTALRKYYPTINQYSIENYIDSNVGKTGKVDISENIGNLMTILGNTINASVQTKAEYRSRQLDISEAWRHNKQLDRVYAETGEKASDDSYVDMSPLYAKKYITSAQEKAANELANELVNYSLVAIEINSVNVHGNQSSDVINNNMLTNIINTLKNPEALENFGKYKFQSRQYDFSNIMLEQIDENGKRIKGLFRKDDNGTLVPTDYAKDLLKIKLFDGASNFDTDENILYHEMAQGDYIGTAFINFFKTDENRDDKGVADYFMRIPSDAPRNFIITAPKYSADKLFTIANQSEVSKATLDMKKKYSSKMLTEEDLATADNKNVIQINKVDQMVRHMMADDGEISYKIPDWLVDGMKLKDGQKLTLKLKYKNSDKNTNENTYLISGIVQNGRLINGSFVGAIDNNFSSDVDSAINKYIDNILERTGVKQYKINRNHIIFKQFKNVFKQELLDAAIAIDKFFVTSDDGLVQRYDETEAAAYNVKPGSIKWREGISHNGREVNGAYDNYHHKKGVIIAKIDGKDTLVGNVFHSDRFKLFDDSTNKERNYGEELMSSMFSLLYGGSKGNYIHVSKDSADANGHRAINSIVLSNEQETIIEDKLEEFINDYVAQSINRLSVFEGSLHGTELNHNNAAEFILNYHLMYNNFNDLFEGDTKFYKDSQTFLKRAKEVQGSGVPYGITNYAQSFSNTRTDVPSRLNSMEFANGYKVTQYNQFVGVTVVNTVKTNDVALAAIRNKLIKDCKLSEKEADKLLKGYQNPKVNDAQSYITFDEWIRRISARGELMKHVPLINKVLNGEELNAEELSNFIQVQKNFYYDQHFDTVSGIHAPRQIKNAEFVLVPQLIKGTELEAVADLMKKYDIDQLNTEETSKAGKTNTLEIFDAKTGEVKQDIINELYGDKTLSKFGARAKEASSLYNYNFLYTQQDTPQHMNAENKAGIQIMKKILDNITPGSKLWDTKQKFFRLYSANIRDSFSSLMRELNLELDENGNLVLEDDGRGNKVIKGLNYEIFYQRLKEEVARLGLDSNMMDYVTLDDTQMFENGGVTIMPNYMSNVSQKLENIAQSVFNNRITRQKLPGFHAAQITNVGWKALATSNEQVSYSKDLKYHVDDKGNYVDYVEIMLPASAFGFKRINDDGSFKTKEELLKELQAAELDAIIGYRIPTEGKQSVCKMKVVGFIDDGYGSTIVVPNDWVTQTGSDFDIDSVYGIQFETVVDPYGHIQKLNYSELASKSYDEYVKSHMTEQQIKDAEEIEGFSYDSFASREGLVSREQWSLGNLDKVAEDNTRAARNNEILECMLEILGSDEALEENLSRSNFDDISHKEDKKNGDYGGAIQKLMNDVVKAKRDSRTPYNFLDQAAYQEDAMSGAKLKAFSVTRDTFCSICNTVKPVITQQHQIKVAYNNKVIDYETAVKRFGKDNVDKQDNKIIITHKTIGYTNDNKNVVGKILTAYSSQTTAHILDAIKEGFVPNVNDMTFAVYKLFPDLGMDYDTAVAFMMQNGVTRIVNAYNATKSIYQTELSDPINSAIKSIARALGFEASDYRTIDGLLKAIAKQYISDYQKIFGESAQITLDDDKLAKTIIDSESLKDNLKNPRRGKDGLLYDLGIVLQYSKLSHLGKAIGDLARVCNPDKFGAKQSIFATNKVFDDIQDIITSDNPLPLVVEGTNFLESIYPGISDGLDSFITSKRDNSVYPPLYNFLKYATATSIKVNRSLFVTQNPEFIEKVKQLQNFFSGTNKITEKQYKDFEKYIIGYLYGQCQGIVRPMTYSIKDDYKGFVAIAEKDENALTESDIFEAERTRVFGYGAAPAVEFEVMDVMNPTQDEVNAFAKLTPAQKVTWVQGHFDDAGVFKYIRTTLFNERATRGNKAGSQTIEFVDTAINIENVYNEFAQAFSSTNPFVALTAYDVVKYGFIVEGFKMKKTGVNKMIPNSILYNDFGIQGTGIVTELQTNMINIGSTLKDHIDDICDDYIRSHRIPQIPSVKVRRPKGKAYELYRLGSGIIQIGKDKEGEALAEKYKVIYKNGPKSQTTSNSYVRLKFGDKETLYRIVDTFTGWYLYPTNKLEENEHGDFSSNNSNNIYASRDYYLNIINEYNEHYYDFDAVRFKDIADKYNIKEFKAKTPETVKAEDMAIDFNLEHPNNNLIGAVDHLKKEVQKHFGDNQSSNDLILLSSGFKDNFKKSGSLYGLKKTFILNEGSKNERLITLRFFRLDKNTIKKSIQIYLGKNHEHDEIKPGHERYRPIIEKLRSMGITNPNYNDIYVLTPYVGTAEETSATMQSSIAETLSAGYRGISRRITSVHDVDAAKAVKRLKDKGIEANKTSVANHIEEVARINAEYIETVTEKTMNNLKYFVQDPNGDGYLSVTDPGVIDLIKHDEPLRRKYLKTILDAEAIVKNFGLINELDISSQDPDIQRYLRKIKENVNNLQNSSIIRNAKELFANDYLAKLSDDPRIQRDILNILDGYASTNWFTSWVGDLQETTSPLIQVISKQVMSDIRAKEAEATRTVRNFAKFMKDIKAKANAAGKSFNWDNIVDENGRFIQDYAQKLVDDMNELRDNLVNAKATMNLKTREGVKEYLEAKLAYDKWKLEHIEQELDDDYYRKQIALDEEMLHGVPATNVFASHETTKGHPIVFVEYKRLEARRNEILSHIVNGVLEDSLQQELKQIRQQIKDLTNPFYHDPVSGELVARVEYDPYTNPLSGTPEEQRQKILYSASSQRALAKYLKEVRDLQNEYFQYNTEFAFQEELERNLHIIESYEKRDANGNISVPLNLLMENEEYVKAKEWIQNNAQFVITPKDDAGFSLVDKINEAFKTLNKGNSRNYLRSISKNKEAYDNHGTLDATKFTDEEIAKIKDEQQRDYDFHEDAPFSDKSLISIGSPTGVLYKREFYNKMTSNGASNPEYYKKVHEINELLAPYYDDGTKTIRFELIPNTDEGKQIYVTLERLYGELAEIKNKVNATNGKDIYNFIKNNVDFNINQAEFDRQEALAKEKGDSYLKAWRKANLEIVETDEGMVAQPNHYIYGYMTPKPEVAEKYTDKPRTEAIQLLNRTYMSVPTEYYYRKSQEMRDKGSTAFKEWYKQNHIWNPYQHKYEPIRCWMTYTYKDNVQTEGEWVPQFNQQYKVPKEDKINKNYKPEAGHALNYKQGTGYDNPEANKANEFELDAKKEVQRILDMLATTEAAKRYIGKGYLPSRSRTAEKDAKYWGKELLKMVGFVEGQSGEETLREGIEYYRDRSIPMPMLNLLKQKDLSSLNLKKPERLENESDDEFAKRVVEYEDAVKKLKEENEKAHKDAIDRDWESVIQDFIVKAAHYNAVQENKYLLFYGRSMLDNIGIYSQRYGFFGDLKKDYINSDETTAEYIKQKDNNLIGQYENWVRRIVYNQWKESNKTFTKWASRLQSITSAQYMTLNIRGGIANVTLGETQIIAEAFAEEYFGGKDWAKGKAYWMSGVPSYFARLYKQTSTSVPDAIIKWFNILDFDELTGKSRIIEDPVTESLNRLNSAMYSTLTMGEHYMQNSALFSMMNSHRLYEVLDKETNKKTIVFKNEREAMRDADINAVYQILKDDTRLNEFKTIVENTKKDANALKEYVWFRRDFITDFVKQYFNKEEQEKFIETRKKLQDDAKAEFYNDESHPTILSQMALDSDEQLGFKPESLLAKYDIAKEDGSPSDAYRLLATFRGRVISVNKKIHGIYDRLGEAQVEKKWWGSLVMQYHKHMYPGVLKRWRRQGSFNEERGTIEKGSYTALWDFLSLPFTNPKFIAETGMNEANAEAMHGIQNIFKDIVDFATNISLNWNLLPQHERDNIARNLGDLMGIVSALFVAIALRMFGDDDDEDSIAYNLALYEADRLSSESFQFNPFGMISEGKKLWSTPIAAQSGVQDLIQSIGILSHILIEGDEFDPYYHSGRYAGEHKLSVYIQRRIPVWRNIKTGFIDITESNSYYKMGQNMLGIVPVQRIADWGKEEFDIK